jgi:hypothetical protein
MMRPILAILISATVAFHADAFTASPRKAYVPIRQHSNTIGTVQSVIHGEDEKAVECFLVNDEDVVENGATPGVVCTSAPDEYAWFNGLDPEALLPTDDINEHALECVEGASPRGIPEWECREDP